MKRAGNYGYSPEQLARINERRQARGRDILVDKKFDDSDYAKRYTGESESYAAKKNKPATPAFPSERPSALDQYKGQKSLRDRMAERPSALGNQPSSSSLNQQDSMASRRAIAEEELKRKFGKGQKGISTPMTKDAMERVMGTA
jgi:hypothetical protein